MSGDNELRGKSPAQAVMPSLRTIRQITEQLKAAQYEPMPLIVPPRLYEDAVAAGIIDPNNSGVVRGVEKIG